MKQKLFKLFMLLAVVMTSSITWAGTEFTDFSLDFTKDWAATNINTSGAASKYYVTATADGVPTLETTKPDSYEAYFVGYYKNSTYGFYYNAKFEVPVTAGRYTIKLGMSDYGGDIVVTDGTNTLATINNNGAKYSVSSSNVATGEVTVTSDCTLQIYASSNATNVYFPYIEVKKSFKNFKINFTKDWASSSTITQGTTYYVTATDANGVPTFTSTQPDSYLCTFNGKYHSTGYGITSTPVFTVAVDGPVKITYGMNDYGDDIKGTNTNGESVVTGNSKGAKFSSDPANVVDLTYSGEATTLTLTGGGYVPYFAVEACTVASEVTVTYYDVDGTTVIGTETVSGGSKLAYKYSSSDVTVASGKVFRGWFDGTTSTAKKVAEGTTVSADLALYAKATDKEVISVPSTFTYDLTKDYFYAEDHELISITNGAWHDNQHGWAMKNGGTITLNVAANAIVSIANCAYSGSSSTVTVTDASNNVLNTYNAIMDTDGANTSVTYNGTDATTLTITFSGQAYVHSITVMNVNNAPVKANGYYQIPAGDAETLKLAAAMLEDGDKIFLPNGTYDLGSDLTSCKSGMTISAKNVSLIGESRDGVIVKGYGTTESINTATLKVTGDNFYAQDLTLQCNAKYGTGSDTKTAERGVALWNCAAHSTMKNVYLKGTQDTYYTNGAEGQLGYVEDGKIEGTVDFICGAGNHYFNGVNLYAANSSTAGSGKTTGDYLTAPNTASSELYGYVFKDAVIDGESSQAGTYYLARAWNNEPRCTYINATKNIATATDVWTKMSSFSGTSHFADVTDETGYEIGTVLGDWATTAQSEAKQAKGVKDGTVFLYNNTISTELPTEGTVRVANTRGGFGPEVSVNQMTTITTNAAGWASFCPVDYNATISGATACIATAINGTKVELSSISSIPENEGVFVKGEANTTYAVSSTSEDADAVTGNMIIGCTSETTLAGDGTEYIMGVVNDVAGLWQIKSSGVTIPVGKAYLKTSAAGAKMLTLDFATDGVANISTGNTKSSVFYNLAGQKVVGNYKGIVIGTDGKKYIK